MSDPEQKVERARKDEQHRRLDAAIARFKTGEATCRRCSTDCPATIGRECDCRCHEMPEEARVGMGGGSGLRPGPALPARGGEEPFDSALPAGSQSRHPSEPATTKEAMLMAPCPACGSHNPLVVAGQCWADEINKRPELNRYHLGRWTRHAEHTEAHPLCHLCSPPVPIHSDSATGGEFERALVAKHVRSCCFICDRCEKSLVAAHAREVAAAEKRARAEAFRFVRREIIRCMIHRQTGRIDGVPLDVWLAARIREAETKGGE